MSFDILWLLGAYLVGSIPFGLLVGYIFGKGDIRKLGSGNIGATNVLRCVGRVAAAIALIGDAGKGAVIIIIYTLFVGGNLGGWILLLCVLGHNFSIWLRFGGGKGVATSFGGLLGIDVLGLILVVVWLFVYVVFRISSLSALVSFGVLPILVIYFGFDFWVGLPFILLSLLIFMKHKGNIGRLLRGEEKRIKL